MTTLAQAAAVRRRLPIAPAPALPPDPSIGKYDTPSGLWEPTPPPTSLANDSNVMAAYQALMQGTATGDLNKGIFKRNLTTNLEQGQKDRLKTVLQSHQSMNDRGMLNSGVALGREGDINTGYDSLMQNLNNQYGDQVGAIDKSNQLLRTAYDNSQIVASAKYTADQAKAAGDALTAQHAADEQQRQIQDLIASLTQQPVAAPVFAPSIPAPRAPIKPKAPPKAPAPKVSGATGALKQTRIGGPQ